MSRNAKDFELNADDLKEMPQDNGLEAKWKQPFWKRLIISVATSVTLSVILIVVIILATSKTKGDGGALTKCDGFETKENMKLDSKLLPTDVGSTISVQCKEGFVLTGAKSVTCLSNQTWSESPSCTMIDCGKPGNVRNGQIENFKASTYNSTFLVKCSIGHKTTGSQSVRCAESGHWDRVPSCDKVKCGNPRAPKNGKVVSITGTAYWDNVTMTCDEGFSMLGNPVARCRGHRSWSTLPSCEKIGQETITDCYDSLHKAKYTKDGVYKVSTWKTAREIHVYCDMTTDGGGWTVFQNRFNGSVNFYRNFTNYREGFGDVSNEFWLGLDNIHEMTSQGPSELRIEVSSSNGTKGYLNVKNFEVSPGPAYALIISHGEGTIGDDVNHGLSYNNGSSFSTYDHDVDTDNTHCARNDKGGWWYKNCTFVNLNGEYCEPGSIVCSWSGMIYDKFDRLRSLLTSRMMFRRVL